MNPILNPKKSSRTDIFPQIFLIMKNKRQKNSPGKSREAAYLLGFQLGAPGGTRTPDPLLRRQLLYPPELLAHKIMKNIKFYRLLSVQKPHIKIVLRKNGAGDGNRTHVSSLEGWCSTIELHPRVSQRNYTITGGLFCQGIF